VKKLVVLGASAIAASTIAVLSAGLANSDPVNPNQMNVVGEPYYKAAKILKGMGIKPTFGGAVGDALPQAQCMVASQKAVGTVGGSGGSGGSMKMLLNLDCTQKAADEMAESGTAGGAESIPGGKQVDSNGVTHVQATPVGPQPGMPMPAG
jgi:hypothetical protein